MAQLMTATPIQTSSVPKWLEDCDDAGLYLDYNATTPSSVSNQHSPNFEPPYSLEPSQGPFDATFKIPSASLKRATSRPKLLPLSQPSLPSNPPHPPQPPRITLGPSQPPPLPTPFSETELPPIAETGLPNAQDLLLHWETATHHATLSVVEEGRGRISPDCPSHPIKSPSRDRLTPLRSPLPSPGNRGRRTVRPEPYTSRMATYSEEFESFPPFKAANRKKNSAVSILNSTTSLCRRGEGEWEAEGKRLSGFLPPSEITSRREGRLSVFLPPEKLGRMSVDVEKQKARKRKDGSFLEKVSSFLRTGRGDGKKGKDEDMVLGF
ncbi:hypothetical protein BCR34DRAFT_593395 [Clohesyomyces aquaticus]|uniref:Uncharacterized protein n=1 Tax=Clohesyomyces aquaticus TaxID=1231657 RepID=A0A1Y1YI72_9PLEO|nr:hypothetical protein BCR34DRAFT_593395 [Clohesyomyces aquaticus]